MHKNHYIRPSLARMDTILNKYDKVIVLLDNSRFPRFSANSPHLKRVRRAFRGLTADLPDGSAIVEIKCHKCTALAHLLFKDESKLSRYNLDIFIVDTATRKQCKSSLMHYEKLTTANVVRAVYERLQPNV